MKLNEENAGAVKCRRTGGIIIIRTVLQEYKSNDATDCSLARS